MTALATALVHAGLAPLAAALQTTVFGTRVRIAQPWLLWLAPLALLLT